MTLLLLSALASEGAEHAANHASGESSLSGWGVFNFVVLVGAIVFFSRKKFAEAFSSKQGAIRKAVDEAEALRKSVDAMVKEYQGKLSQLDHEITTILAEAKKEGEREKAEILARAERLAEKIRKDAVSSAEKENERMKAELERETMIQAAKLATELLKKRVTEKEHQAFTHELIEHLESIG